MHSMVGNICLNIFFIAGQNFFFIELFYLFPSYTAGLYFVKLEIFFHS